MPMSKKEQQKINRKRVKILAAINAGNHLRVDIEAATGMSYLSGALGQMVKLGMLHTRPSGQHDKKWNPINSYLPGSGDGHVSTPAIIDDGMANLLRVWPVAMPQAQAQARQYRLTDERHNGSGLSCARGIGIQSSMR